MKMNANDVIESYVTDVALQLPRKQRNDVAFELRALINEGLQDKAEETGRAIDAAMATEFLNAFGHPEAVAARYRPALNNIDPAEGHKFLRATFIGLAIIWGLGLLQLVQTTPDVGLLNALGKWWVGTVVGSLWWPGVMVAGFGISAWVGRRWPQNPEWKPKANDRIHGGRISLVMGVLGIMCGVFLLVDPHWILDFFWNGKAAPAAYQALTYTESFLQLQGPVLLVLLLLNIPLFVAVIVKGRWSPLLRRIQIALTLADIVAMMWVIVGGPVLMSPQSDGMAKLLILIIVLITLASMAFEWYQSVKPHPTQTVHAR